MSSEGDIPGDAARCVKICRFMCRGVLVWQYISHACGISRTYEACCFGLAAWREVR